MHASVVIRLFHKKRSHTNRREGLHNLREFSGFMWKARDHA